MSRKVIVSLEAKEKAENNAFDFEKIEAALDLDLKPEENQELGNLKVGFRETVRIIFSKCFDRENMVLNFGRVETEGGKEKESFAGAEMIRFFEFFSAQLEPEEEGGEVDKTQNKFWQFAEEETLLICNRIARTLGQNKITLELPSELKASYLPKNLTAHKMVKVINLNNIQSLKELDANADCEILNGLDDLKINRHFAESKEALQNEKVDPDYQGEPVLEPSTKLLPLKERLKRFFGKEEEGLVYKTS